MIVHNEYAQGSADWAIARSGLPTASEFDALLTPEFKARSGQTPATYLAKKLGEWWQGGPEIGFNTFAVEQGQVLEAEARPWYQLEYGKTVEQVGFITTDCGSIGCSPDGIIDGKTGVEIKCPAMHTHVAYLLDGDLPKDYACQIHGGMYVTGFKEWKFISYRRHFPKLVLTIARDEEIQEKIDTALRDFLEKFEAGKRRLIEINGGPPKRSPLVKPMSAPRFVPNQDVNDLVTP